MTEEVERRFEIVVEEGIPRGDLYELEQTTYYRVIDRRSGQTVLSFESRLEAALSTETGQWEGTHTSGVQSVTVAEDQRWVVVRYQDGHEESLVLPE